MLNGVQWMMLSLLTPPFIKPSAGRLQDDWFFGQQSESFLSRWQIRAEARPLPYLIWFFVYWFAWTVGYMITLQYHGPVSAPVHTAPHIAFSAILTGSILFPRQNWWLPMATFTLLFVITLSDDGMSYLLTTGTGMTLGAVSFALNLGLGLSTGYVVHRMSRMMARNNTLINADVAKLALLFFALPVMSVIIHLGEMGLVWLNDWGRPEHAVIFGYSWETLLHVVHRGVRGGMITLAIVVLFVRAPLRLEVWLFIASLPFFALMTWGFVRFGMIYPELQMAAIVLIYGLVMPAVVTAMIVLFVFWPLAAWSGAFMVPKIGASGGEIVVEATSSVLIVLLALLVLARLQAEIYSRRREVHFEKLEKLRELAGGGRLIVHRQKGRVRLDLTVQAVAGLQEHVDVATFLRRFDEESRRRFLEAFAEQPFRSQAVHMRRALGAGKETVDIKIYLWAEGSVEKDPYAYGFVVNVSEEYAQKRQLDLALSRLEV